MRQIVGALVISLGLVGGCASVAPEPCTDAWFDREAREAFKPVRRDLEPTLNRLRKASAALENPGPLAAARLAIAVENAARLLEAFDQRVLPRLRQSADQCKDPAFVRRAVFDFLDDEGLDELEALIEGFDARLVPQA